MLKLITFPNAKVSQLKLTKVVKEALKASWFNSFILAKVMRSKQIMIQTNKKNLYIVHRLLVVRGNIVSQITEVEGIGTHIDHNTWSILKLDGYTFPNWVPIVGNKTYWITNGDYTLYKRK